MKYTDKTQRIINAINAIDGTHALIIMPTDRADEWRKSLPENERDMITLNDSGCGFYWVSETPSPPVEAQ